MGADLTITNGGAASVTLHGCFCVIHKLHVQFCPSGCLHSVAGGQKDLQHLAPCEHSTCLRMTTEHT